MGSFQGCMYALTWAKFTERGFSVNKEVIDHNMKEKWITSQPTVYDGIQEHSSNKVSNFPISAEMTKSCSLSHQRYKGNPQKNKKEAVQSDLILMRKAKESKTQKVKHKISGVESCIKSLGEKVFKQTRWQYTRPGLCCANCLVM